MAEQWLDYNLICRALIWSNDATVGQGLFMGCDNQLWLYKIEQDSYIKIGELASEVYIRRLWINTKDSNKVYGVGWKDTSHTSMNISLVVFSYNGSTFSIITTIYNVFNSEWAYHSGKSYSSYINTPVPILAYFRGIGRTTNFVEGSAEALVIPFKQNVRLSHSSTSSDHLYFYSKLNLTGIDSKAEDVFYSSGYSKNNFETFDPGYYAVRKGAFSAPTTPIDLRTSLNWKGCIELLSFLGSKGSLLYPILAIGSYDYYFITFKVLDFNTLISTEIAAMNPFRIYFNTGFDTTTVLSRELVIQYPPTPTAIAVDNENSCIYLASMLWYSDTLSSGQSSSFITKISNLPGGIKKSGTITNNYYSGYIYDTGATFNSTYLGKYAVNSTTGNFGVITEIYRTGSPGILKVSNSFPCNSGNTYSIYTTEIKNLYCSSAPSPDPDNQFRTFLDMKKSLNNNFLYLTFMQRDKLNNADFCGIGTHSILSSDNSLNNCSYFFNIPEGLVEDPLGVCAYITVGGNLYKYDPTSTASVCGGGDFFVENEPNLSSNLCVVPYDELNQIDTECSRKESVIFGISAPFFSNETQEEPTSGKYYLWKYDNYLTDRIELADFSDMSIWDALSALVESALDYVMGFDSDDEGNFFLVKKKGDYVIDLDISTDDIDKNLISIKKDRGLDEVYNYVEISPSVIKSSEIKIELHLNPRSTEYESNKAIKTDDIYVDPSISSNISIRLVCDADGSVSAAYPGIFSSADTTDRRKITSSPRFKWQVFEKEIQALILGDVSSGSTSIQVASTFRGGTPATILDSSGNSINKILPDAINIGDYITISDPKTQKEEIKRINNIVSTTLTIDSGFSFGIKSNTTAIITHPFDVETGNKGWSSEGVTILSDDANDSSTIYVEDIRDLSEYTIVKCGSSSDIARIKTIGDFNAAHSGYTITLTGGTISSLKGTLVEAYFSPCKDENSEYSYFKIGGTPIKMKIAPTATNVNNLVYVGDRITITSEGLSCEASEQSKQIAYDVTSINERGRLEFTEINSKFIRRVLAKHLVKKIIQEFSSPHYILNIEIPLYPSLKFISSDGHLTRIRVRSKQLFPKYNEVVIYLQEISHDLKGTTTSIRGRDVSSY